MTNKTTKRALLSSVLALFLCFTMLLGTTYAWFTDEVTSAGNVIQTGSLKVGFQHTAGTEVPTTTDKWETVNGALFDYENWEPGYAVAKHLKVTNEGTLALNYQMRIVADGIVSDLANVIDVYVVKGATAAVTRDALKSATPIGTLMEVLGTEKHLTKYINGSIVAGGDAHLYSIAFVMQEEAGNEYQNMDLGCTFSIELIASQMMSEKDSFGPEYDELAPDPEVPAALVTVMKDKNIIYTTDFPYGDNPLQMELDTAYQFEPTSGPESVNGEWIVDTYPNGHPLYDILNTVENSAYKDWHADFVVSADKVVPAESMALAGYYSLFCDDYNNGNWVALTSSEDIAANTEIRLVENMAGGFYVNWRELCNYGNDNIGFRCGAVDLTGVNGGTTLTVELRLFETYPKDHEPHDGCKGAGSTNCETGKSIVVGKFTYTFGGKKVADQAELDAALAAGCPIVELGAGEYTLPNTNGKTVEIVGTKDTVIDVTRGYYADQANLTFRGVTFDCTVANANGGDYELLYSPNVTFIDCTFNGSHGVGRDGASYIGCTFNLPVDYVWSFANDTVFDGCTFNSQGKALLLYNHGGSEMVNVTVKNCVFNATAGAKAYAIANQNCAAIEIDNYGCSFNLIFENNTYNSNFFSGEWRIKSFYGNGNTVTVNGVSYNTIAIDGSTMTIDADRNVTVL